jgi:hypothetical protein
LIKGKNRHGMDLLGGFSPPHRHKISSVFLLMEGA